MDVALMIRRRLEELKLGQKDLARSANVTESYVSQLLSRRKAPPVPARTEIHEKMERLLKLLAGDLSRIADVQRKEELKRELGEEPTPLFPEMRALILRKCRRGKVRVLATIFEKQPFGELEWLLRSWWMLRRRGASRTAQQGLVAQVASQTEKKKDITAREC